MMFMQGLNTQRKKQKMNNREEKWNYIVTEIIQEISNIETSDIETEIMKLNIMSNLLRMAETEETFNDVLDILNKNKTRVFRRDRE